MVMAKRLIMWVGAIVTMAAPAFAQAPAGQGEFVPMNSLPPADQLPAAPLLVAAYAFVWVALAVYLWSIWSRLGRVERDIQALRQQRSRGGPR